MLSVCPCCGHHFVSARRLAASEDVFGVTIGGILGHGVCTGAAVLGGRHLATHINEQSVAVRRATFAGTAGFGSCHSFWAGARLPGWSVGHVRG